MEGELRLAKVEKKVGLLLFVLREKRCNYLDNLLLFIIAMRKIDLPMYQIEIKIMIQHN